MGLSVGDDVSGTSKKISATNNGPEPGIPAKVVLFIES